MASPAQQLRHTRRWLVVATALAAACAAFGRLFVVPGSVAPARCGSARGQGRGSSLALRAAAPGAGGAIETFLLRGPLDAATVASRCAPLANHFDLNCIAFLSMGVKPELLASVAGGSLGFHGVCPVFIAETYGLVGWDDAAKANVEMIETGLGGAGGQGLVVVAFRGGGHLPASSDETGEALPEEKALHLVIRSEGAPDKPPAGAVYGSLAKACYKLEHSGDLLPVQQFSVSTPFAVLTSFDDASGQVAQDALGKLPPVAQPPIAAGYFSGVACGANKYGKDGVEPKALAAKGLDGVRLFGTFGRTLGPPVGEPVICNPELMVWTSILDDDPRPDIELESTKSVLALYGK